MERRRDPRRRDEREATTIESKFWRLLLEANRKIECDESQREFWWGYLKGLSRRYHGTNFSPRMHEELMKRQDPIGEGYRAGLSEEL
jgi:hypothetical protein